MMDQSIRPMIGRCVLGAGSAGLGAAGLVWGAFAFAWQAIPPEFPAYRTLAYIAGVLLLLSGLGVLVPRRARTSACILAGLYSLFAVPWAIRVVRFPEMFGVWGGLAEMISLVLAAVIVIESGDVKSQLETPRRVTSICIMLYGMCAVVFGFNHFFSLEQTAGMVPAWLPPGQMFWAVVTGVFHCAAGIAILAGVYQVLAARLLACMMLVFEALVWFPSLLKAPDVHMVWAGNAVDIALAGAAFVVADALARKTDRRGSSDVPSQRANAA